MDEPPSRSNLEALLTAYRKRFKDDPPLMGVDKDDLARRIQEALTTGRAIRTEDFGVPPDAYVSPSSFTWQEGRVDPAQPRLQIYYVPNIENPETAYLVAIVSTTPIDQRFAVEFLPQSLPATLAPGPVFDEVKRELDFFFIEKREKDPVKYLRYHCTTASNVYSHIQWVR